MSINTIDIDEVIYKLLQGLRQKGFSIGTDAYIKTTDLFHWFLKEKKGNNFTDFAPYLAPLICKSDEEQTNFRQLFQELFTNEFTAFENRFFAERKLKEVVKREKSGKLLKYIASLVVGCAAFFAIYSIWQQINRHPIPVYENLLSQPFYVNKNDTVSFTKNAVFKNIKDTGKFDVEYHIRSTKQKRKGFSSKHYFGQYGKDTISVKITSKKAGLDSTLEFSNIFIGPEKPTITAEKNDIETGDENTFTANIDTTINTGYYWEIKKLNNENDSIKPIQINSKTLIHAFNEEGEYLISVKYNKSTSAFPKDFPDEKLTASFYQKVKTPGLQLEANHTLPEQTTNTNVNTWWFMGLSLLSLIFFYITYKIFKENKKKKADAKNPTIDIFSGDKPPYDLHFLNRNKNISYTYDLLRLSNHLKKRIDSPDFFLDISKTIKQSIANRGFPTPGFSQKQQTRQCLILIDQVYKNSQQVKLFSYLAMYLIKQQVKLDFYFYYQTPDKFYTDEDGPRITIQTLKDRYYNCSLILFTDGTNFPEYNAAILKETITIGFAYWQQRLLVTPVNYNDWGRNEKLLSTFFNVIPADVVGLLELIRAMDTDSSENSLLLSQFYTYESKHVDFNTVKGLQEYLKDEELFQWLCALSIHPKIYWEVILEIGKAIVANPTKINYENLLKLARIQWVHEGNFPTATRLELLKVLTGENEIKARDAFLKMLDDIPMGDEQFSYEEKQISRYANSFVLFATGIQKYTADKNIQAGEEKFISLYKDEHLSDNAFKIYIEKKETEHGNWNTPVNNENGNIGIEKYIHNKEEAHQNNLRNERLIRNKKLAQFAACAISSLLLLCYLIFTKNAIAKSSVNDYLHLADTSIQINNTTIVKLDTRNCFYKLLVSSKDTVANIEISNETSVLFRKNITPVDSFFVTSILKNLPYDSNKTIIYKLTVNGQLFTKQIPLVAGTHNISLIGCERETLNITYNAGYNEDTTPVFNAFKGTEYSIKVIPTSDYEKQPANRVIFDSAIGRNTMFAYGDNLIKAGFRFKNITIRNGEKNSKNIIIDGEKNLSKLPIFTIEKLRELLLNDTIRETKKLTIKIIAGADVALSKITQVKSCLKNNFDISTTQIVNQRSNMNEIKYFNKNFRDSVKYLLACLKTHFPDKTFEVIKSASTKGNTIVAEIYLLNESRYMPRVSITVSDEILIPQANRFRNDLIKGSYNISPITINQNIRASIIEYHSPDQLTSANEIKKIYSSYFRTSQISLQSNPDPKNKFINVRIKSEISTTERFYITDAKFPKSVNENEKLSVAFIITSNNLNRSLPSTTYTGKICIIDNYIKQSNANKLCENFTFKRDAKTIISKEIIASYAAGNKYPVRVIIDQLKIDTVIGQLTIKENANLNNNADIKNSIVCDTIYTYIGPSEDNFVFNGNTYEKNNLKRKGIECILLKKDAKSVSINISKGKCPALNIFFYSGETKMVTLCDDTKITLTFINSAKTSTNRKNDWALFEVILCKNVSTSTRKK